MNNYLKYIILFIVLSIISIGWANNRYQAKLRELPHVNFKSVEKDLKTGDLVLCSGSINQITPINLKYYSMLDCVKFSIIKTGYYMFFDTLWSHAGVIIKKNGKVYVYENTNGDVPLFDYFTKTSKQKGTRMVLLEDKIKTYSGKIAIQHLNKPLKNTAVKLPIIKFKSANILDLVFKRKTMDNQNYDSSTQMCSEFIFNFLKSLNIMDSKYSPKVIAPCDFNDKWVKYQDGYKHLEPFIVE